MSKLSSQNKQILEETPTKLTFGDLKTLQEKNTEYEKELKSKQIEVQTLTNQNLYLKEQLNTMQIEYKSAKNSLLALKRSQFLNSQSKSEENLKLGSEKTEKLLKKLQNLRQANEENLKKIELLKAKEDENKKESAIVNENLMKQKEIESILTDKCRSLEKDLVSQKEITNSYKKKYEELSVEVGLLSERLKYKDETIKRDSERIKELREKENEFFVLKRNYQELETTNKQLSNKNEMIVENMIREREKWLQKESNYFKTIDNLEGNIAKESILKHFCRSNSLAMTSNKTQNESKSSEEFEDG